MSEKPTLEQVRAVYPDELFPDSMLLSPYFHLGVLLGMDADEQRNMSAAVIRAALDERVDLAAEKRWGA